METGNRMVDLAMQLREWSHGLCIMGSGPYGFGVSTDAISPLKAVLHLTPVPFAETDFQLSEEQVCTAKLLGIVEEGGHIWRYLLPEELLEFCRGGDPAARIVADTLRRINDAQPAVTVGECMDAYDIMADWEIMGTADCSPAEQAFLSALSKASEPRTGMEMTV